MDSKHTPTPWKFGHSEDDGIGDITDEDGCLIADCYSNNVFDGATCIENARFIIRAVNAHNELLKCAKTFRRFLVSLYEGEDDDMTPTDIVKAVEIAIAEAEGR